MDGNGQVVAADRERRQIARRSASNVSVVEAALATGFNGAMFNGPNDLVIDAAGGIYFTDPDYDGRGQTQAVYYLNPTRFARADSHRLQQAQWSHPVARRADAVFGRRG